MNYINSENRIYRSGYYEKPMANNLLKAGYDPKVYNTTKEKAAELLKNGAEWAKSPSEVGKEIDILFSMLEKPGVVEKLPTGEEGF